VSLGRRPRRSHRRRAMGAPEHARVGDASPLRPAGLEGGLFSEEDLDRILEQEIVNEIESKPEMFQELFEDLDRWREDFVARNGREPGVEDLEEELLDDLVDATDEVFEEPELEEYLEEYDEDVARFLAFCGWCGKYIPRDAECFGFGINLHMSLVRNEAASDVMSLPLPNVGKDVPAFVSRADSPAGEDAYDLLVHMCSEACSEHCRQALRENQRLANLGMVN